MNTQAKRAKKIKKTPGYIGFTVINITILTLLSLTFVLPFVNIIATSLSSAEEVKRGIVFLPKGFTSLWYEIILESSAMWRAFGVSVARTVIGCIAGVLVNYMTAYALSRATLPFKKSITIFLMIPMFIGAGLVPQYIVYSTLGLVNSFWVYIVPLAFSYYNVMMMRSYILGIPESLKESARLDGANEFTIMFKIMMPLSLPIIATILLWTAVLHWNNWTDALIYTKYNSNLWTLQFYLQQVMADFKNAAADMQKFAEDGRLTGASDSVSASCVNAALIIFTSLPIVCAYPFLQKYFVSGTLTGGVKE